MSVSDSKNSAAVLKHIDEILRKGNDVLIQNRKNGIVVIEQKKNITLKIENSEMNE